MRLIPSINLLNLEICASNKKDCLGFDVEVKYNPHSALGKVRSYETFRNVTEIHWRYNTYGEPRVAIETQIHGTGGTYALTDIEHLDISAAIVKGETF